MRAVEFLSRTRAVTLSPFVLPMATRILIADDHEMMRAALRDLINSHADWQICAEANNGREAVEQAKQLQPDLIVLDLAMPVMDGMAAAREITRNRPEARVILFTLHGTKEVEEHAKQAGVRRVVSKVKDGGRLVMAMEEVLREPQTHVADPRGPQDGASAAGPSVRTQAPK